MNRIGLMLLLGCSSQKDDDLVYVDDTGTAAQEPTAPAEDSGESTSDTGQPPSALSFETEERLLLTESLGDCHQAAVVDDYLHLCTDDDGTTLRDERDGSATSIGSFDTIAAVRTVAGDIVLALDGATYTYTDGELAPLETPISVPVTHLARTGETVWLSGGGRLFRWVDDRISEISVPDHPTIYSHAVVGERLFLAVPWLIEASWGDGLLQVDAMGDQPVTSLAGDAEDNLWFVADAQLYIQRPGESARQVELPEDVETVLGPTVWVQGTTQTYQFRDNQWSVHSLTPLGGVGVDGHGRLLQQSDGALVRHSIDRPVVVTGLSDSLTVQETAQLLPSDPDSVTSLQAWLDDTPLEVYTDPWTVELTPEDLAEGAHRLRFFVESDLGDTQDEHPVWVSELPDVEWAEIAEISEAHCIGCHGGTTLTDLSTRADWERLIDPIIYQVSIASMPQGGPYLSEDQIALIRGWKSGGFL